LSQSEYSDRASSFDSRLVIPAKAGIQRRLSNLEGKEATQRLDSRLRGNDEMNAEDLERIFV